MSSKTGTLLSTGGTSRTVTVQVIGHKIIAPEVVTLFLAQPGTHQGPGPYLPGQFITLIIPHPDGKLYRSYSLCGSGNPREPWEITVKRISGGMVSNYLHDQVQVGTFLQTLPARGAFILPAALRPEQSFVFVAVGSGITPIRGFLRAIAAMSPARRPQVQLHYASRSPQETIYRDELLSYSWLKQWHYLRTEGPRMTAGQIFTNAYPLSGDTQWYVCGPENFNLHLRQTLTSFGVPADFIRFEVFADQSRQNASKAASMPIVGSLTIRETGQTVDARQGETLLECLERHNYQPEFGCRAGSCGSCQLHVLQGRVSNPGEDFLTTSEIRSGMVLGCIAQPQGEITLESGGIPPRGTPILVKSGGRNTGKYLLRLVAALGIGALTVGVWPLTNHKVVTAAETRTFATATANTKLAATVTMVAAAATSTSANATATVNTANANASATAGLAPTPTPTPKATATPTPTATTRSS